MVTSSNRLLETGVAVAMKFSVTVAIVLKLARCSDSTLTQGTDDRFMRPSVR
jgi:hypothetical protein